MVLALCALPTACRWHALPEAPPPAASEEERWVQDAHHALALLRSRHPRLDHAVPLARFEAELDALPQDPGALTRAEVFLALMRMVALASDAHTRLADWNEIADLRLPISVTSWSDGYWIEAVGATTTALWGRRITSVGGRPMAEVLAALAPLVPHENEPGLAQGVAALLSLPRALEHVGLAADARGAHFGLATLDGAHEELWLEALPAAELRSWVFVAPAGWEAPLWRSAPSEPWWWRELDDGRTLYLQYNRCLRRAERSFADCVRALLGRFDAGGVERLVVDLRLNGGGDSSVVRPLLDGLRARGLRGERVVVAIGAGTFSSGMLAAWELQRELDALLVGEPSGQKPDSFGEVRELLLPNTGWRLSCSTKRFRLFGDDRPSLAPDVRVEQRFADLVAGRDPLLDRLRDLPR